MTHRERFVNLFLGKCVDRVPFIDAMGPCNFPSCIDRWKTEGLAATADQKTVQQIVGFDYVRGYYIPAKLLFYPEFDETLVKREGETLYYRNKWGGLELRRDGSELMPLTLEGPVKDRHSWESVKERLKGGVSGRLPRDFHATCKEAAESGLPVYTGDLPAGFFGAAREIMGFENFMYVFYDDPELLEEILDTLCDLWIGIYREMLNHLSLDYIFIWEDMCNKTGPLISPAAFRAFMLPRYKRLVNALRKDKLPLFLVDSDGDERPLVPLWLEAGVDIVFPWETQFGLDITEVRRQFPTMGMMGGLNKHALEAGRTEMDAELRKVPYMLEKGYYIPCCDHGVTNDVPWTNYLYFYGKLREMIYKYSPR